MFFWVGDWIYEDDVVFRLKGGDDGAITGLVGDGFAIDRCNDRSLSEADLVGKGAGRTLVMITPPLIPVFAAMDGGMPETVMPSLPSLHPLPAGRRVRPAGRDVGVGLGTVSNDDVGGVLFAVAQIAYFDANRRGAQRCRLQDHRRP